MSEFREAQILTCPWCKTKFASCEGPLCSCEEDYHDILSELELDDEDEDVEDLD